MKRLYAIIVVHGSKEKKWEKFCKKIKMFIKKNIFNLNKIFISFINKKKPYILNIINKGIKNSVYNFLIIPLFLSEGKHVKNDLNKIINNTILLYNNIVLFKTNCLNKNKKVINLLKFNYLKIINKILIFIKNIKK